MSKRELFPDDIIRGFPADTDGGFAADNTEGFTASDLALLNEAAAALIARGYEVKAARDIVNNNWQPDGNTVASLTAPFKA